MILNKPKGLGVLLFCLLALFVLFFSLFWFFAHQGSYGGAFLPKDFPVRITQNGAVLLSENTALSLPAGEHRITLEEYEASPELFPLWIFGGEGECVELSAPEDCRREITISLAEPATLSLVGLGERTAGLVTTPFAARFASERATRAGEFHFPRELFLEGITWRAPMRLFGAFSFSEMALTTKEVGKITLFPSSEQTGLFYVDAPNTALYTKNFSLAASAGAEEYYYQAKEHNDTVLDPRTFPIDSFSQLERLADDSLLPTLTENATLRFRTSFSVERSLSFYSHVELHFLSPIAFDSTFLSFSAREEGLYRVTTDEGASLPAAALLFDAPSSHLVWNSAAAKPSRAIIEKQNNLATYNAEPLLLGGEGIGTPELILSAKTQETERAVAELQGNMLTFTLPYQVSLSSLQEAEYELSCRNGAARLEGTLADGVIVTTDAEGKERRFGIAIARKGYHIPVLYLETEDHKSIDSKSQYLPAAISMDASGTPYASVPATQIRVRGRGNSTWKWEKKPYKIHFEEPTSILGLPAAEEWALFANYADKSLMRNRLAQARASKLSFEYCPTQVYVDLFLNGEYQGVYTLGEHLEEGEGRVEVLHEPSNTDCGFFMEAGGVVAGVDVLGMNYFHADLVKFVLIKSPPFNTLTSEQFDYIKEYMLEASRRVREGVGYEDYLDMETLVDWMIMIEFSNNVDCAWRRSTYLIKDAGEKLRFGPVWDFDLAFGNFSKDDSSYSTWVSYNDEDDYVGETWSKYLLADPEFRALFQARWEEMGKVLLQTALSTIEQDYALLAPSAEENFERWKILGVKVAFEPQSTKYYHTYDSQIRYLKSFLRDRAAWLDAQVLDWQVQ